MACFKRFFTEVPRSQVDDLGASWRGSLYRCNIPMDGKPCGCLLRCTNYGTGPLRSHVRDKHDAEFRAVEGHADRQPGQSNMAAIVGARSAIEEKQRENIIVTFAKNALPFQLIEDEWFRKSFGEKIPKGLGRAELAAATKTLKDKVECMLFSKLKGSNVFMMVDGGTLNRTRLLNISLGHNGQSCFHRTKRMVNLTAPALADALQEEIKDLAAQ